MKSSPILSLEKRYQPSASGFPLDDISNHVIISIYPIRFHHLTFQNCYNDSFLSYDILWATNLMECRRCKSVILLSLMFPLQGQILAALALQKRLEYLPVNYSSLVLVFCCLWCLIMNFQKFWKSVDKNKSHVQKCFLNMKFSIEKSPGEEVIIFPENFKYLNILF